ncbi:MAG: thioredoxin family protein, partial [Dysgonamonadaceae bacterium]|nr:thioredoxin family protein [Dysgonamonadaceae bacterium]
NETSWKKAVEKHNMSWLQIISKKEEADDIAKLYGVYLIPYTVLIDGNGKVVGENIRGKELTMTCGQTLLSILEEMKQGYSETGVNLIVFADMQDEAPCLLQIGQDNQFTSFKR